jgi:nitroreductase
MKSDSNPVIGSLRSHRSVRRFTKEPITDEQLETIITTAQQSSTSSNLQSYSVVVVRDQAKKEKLSELCGRQRQIVDCSVFMAHCADLNRAKMVCEAAGYEFKATYFEYFLTAVIDATIFAQTALAAAEGLGLGGCMIGGARNHPYEIAELLELPPLVFVTFGMTVGHPDPDHQYGVRPRLPSDGVVHYERYDSEHLKPAMSTYDETMRATGIYDKRRIDLGARVPGWTDRTPPGQYGWIEHSARRLIDPAAQRVPLRPFLNAQGFELK